ncbi:MAG: Gfo/Idh/MocA family oxidoreductase [Bacteroidales bacterium]|nr:Gfo/Idh/MocA family oxidoreductase [Bacteroidales bacterium]
MNNTLKRRDFIKTAAAGTVGLGLTGKSHELDVLNQISARRVGIIGLDTSHSGAFISSLNKSDAGPEYGGYKVVAAYPKGSSEIKSSYERIPKYTEDAVKLGVEIVNSIGELLQKVDVVLLETNDGRLHLEQVIPVLKAGKRVFIDKPIAASLAEAIAIFDASAYYKVPLFSASSLRYINGAKEISEGSIGKVLGADAYSPGTLEKTHPDLFWYGVHGVETLFTVMGNGCKSVVRTSVPDTDLVVGTWEDGRIGTFRGIRGGKSDYGGIVYGEKAISVLGKYAGYTPLLIKIIEFFNTGIPPVSSAETLEIFTFMAAAEESRNRGGIPVSTAEVFADAKKTAATLNFK